VQVIVDYFKVSPPGTGSNRKILSKDSRSPGWEMKQRSWNIWHVNNLCATEVTVMWWKLVQDNNMFYLGLLRKRLTITLIRVLKVIKLTARKIQFQLDSFTVPSYGLQTCKKFFFKFLTKVQFSVEFFKQSRYIFSFFLVFFFFSPIW